ncbi:hypothetical protein D9M70_459210 [compost metagenome]
MLDVAGDLDRDRTARAAHAEVAIEGSPLVHDDRDGGERDHVVDHGRTVEEALVGRERRLGANDATLAFAAVEQRRFLAADIGAGAGAHLHVEGLAGAEHRSAEHAGLASDLDRLSHRRDRMGIFGAGINEALGGAGRDACDRHALDQHEGITLHDHPVGKGAAVALVGIANDVFACPRGLENRLPLDACREPGAAAAAKAALGHLRDDRLRRHGNGVAQTGKPAMGLVVVE